MPLTGPTLDYLDEAFTSENWIVSFNSALPRRATLMQAQVRIYQVKKADTLGRDLKSANAFAGGKKRKRSKPLPRRRAL